MKAVVAGNIAQLVWPVNAIVTLVNSSEMWFGGVDGAIMRVAGVHYHAQVAAVNQRARLKHGQVVVATQGMCLHEGNFKDIIFVVDDLASPLHPLVYAALMEAKRQNYRSVALPLMRTGVMMGVVEKTVAQVITQMRLGIEQAENDGFNADLYIVVYNDWQSMRLLQNELNLS